MFQGRLEGSVGWASKVDSGHDLAFVGLSPTLDSALTAQSLEPASDSLSPALSAPPPLTHACVLALKINIIKSYVPDVQKTLKMPL